MTIRYDLPTPARMKLIPPQLPLSADAERECRAWARTHYQPAAPINGYWHPAVIAECLRMNEEALPVAAD